MLCIVAGDPRSRPIATATPPIKIGFAGPFVGSLSDRLPELMPKFAARWGRRRPFIALGQGINAVCLYYCHKGCVEKNAFMLILALQVLPWP